MAMSRALLQGRAVSQQQYTQKQRGELDGGGRHCGSLGGSTQRISPGASCGRGPGSQPGPQSPVLGPRCTCGDTGGRGSDRWALNIPGEGGWSCSLSGKSSHVLTHSQLAPEGCHPGPGSRAGPPSSPQRNLPGNEKQENRNGGRWASTPI